ncbi:hypothetical protein E4U59_005917 [Claviceps monticola]|nr:hypothetical protein E4U59_005917 [Claviceps monticola]
MVLEHLNTKVFDSSSLHDCFPGMPSSIPKTASHDANPSTRDGLGDNTKEDVRVLVTVAEVAPRPEPFQLRHKLVTLLKARPRTFSTCDDP